MIVFFCSGSGKNFFSPFSSVNRSGSLNCSRECDVSPKAVAGLAAVTGSNFTVKFNCCWVSSIAIRVWHRAYFWVSGILFILINYAHKFTRALVSDRAVPAAVMRKLIYFRKPGGKNMDVIRDCASRQLAAKEFIEGEWYGRDPGVEWKHGVVIFRRNWYDGGGGGTPFQKPIENQSS